ncbi:MAG: D-alanyl-D-alanine carboxypeptidase [Pseudobdellovibrio sp.]
MKLYSSGFILAFFISLNLFAAKLNTQCTKDAATGLVQGLNNNVPYTIASVTKLFTTHWAIHRLGPTYRYETLIHVTPLGPQIYDVHIEGAMFPYFDRTNFQFLVGELNKIGVSQIHYLTYDEFFSYASDMRTNAMLTHTDDDVTANEIMKDLREDTKTINKDLIAFNAKALALEKLTLPKTLSLTIKDIHPLARQDFRPTAQTKTYKLRSTEIYRTLKELNRNSHNYAAETIFNKLALTEQYRKFIDDQLGLPQEEINLYNGSGYPVVVNNQKLYNQASCRAVVEVLADLRKTLIADGFELKDVAAVAGKDSAADGLSTVTQLYGADQTDGSMMGKTGTVSDTVALAGMISTLNENTYFGTSFSTANTTADRKTSYDKIKDWLINVLIKDKPKGDLDKYVPKAYMAFDKASSLELIGTGEYLN